MLIKVDSNLLQKLTSTEKQVINYINTNSEKLACMSVNKSWIRYNKAL